MTDKIIQASLFLFSRNQVAKDDILNALVGAVTAKYYYQSLTVIPENRKLDEMDLPVELVIPKICAH